MPTDSKAIVQFGVRIQIFAMPSHLLREPLGILTVVGALNLDDTGFRKPHQNVFGCGLKAAERLNPASAWRGSSGRGRFRLLARPFGDVDSFRLQEFELVI